jgi:hypothetical protein
LCDAQSIADRDLVACDLLYRDRVGETYALQFNPPALVPFPRLAPAEAILIKGYDSAEGVARFTAHSAFEDPGSRSDAPERESIEARALVIYPKGRIGAEETRGTTAPRRRDHFFLLGVVGPHPARLTHPKNLP